MSSLLPVTAPFPVRRSAFLLTFLLLSLLFAHPNALRAQSGDSAQKPTHEATALPNWQYGLFAAGGFPLNYQISFTSTPFNGQPDTPSASVKLDFWNAGFVGGHILSALHGSGPLSGRAEAMLEIIPFWLSRYPKQNIVYIDKLRNGVLTQPGYGPIDIFGESATPFLIRWNFQRHLETRILPWAQLGGGLLWTNQEFPSVIGSTSVINFTPQVGFGISTYLPKRKSLDLALKLIHISNAGLGDYDPGITSLQFSAGYSWWK